MSDHGWMTTPDGTIGSETGTPYKMLFWNISPWKFTHQNSMELKINHRYWWYCFEFVSDAICQLGTWNDVSEELKQTESAFRDVFCFRGRKLWPPPHVAGQIKRQNFHWRRFSDILAEWLSKSKFSGFSFLRKVWGSSAFGVKQMLSRSCLQG